MGGGECWNSSFAEALFIRFGPERLGRAGQFAHRQFLRIMLCAATFWCATELGYPPDGCAVSRRAWVRSLHALSYDNVWLAQCEVMRVASAMLGVEICFTTPH